MLKLTLRSRKAHVIPEKNTRYHRGFGFDDAYRAFMAKYTKKWGKRYQRRLQAREARKMARAYAEYLVLKETEKMLCS